MVRQLGAGLLAGLLIACGGGGASTSPGTTAGASPPLSVTAVPTSAGPSPVATTESGTIIAFNGQLPLDDGRELRVRCIGSGGPPIILDGGGIDPSYDEWPDALLEGLATLATTCAYSRAGGTGSTPAERPRTLESMLSDHQQMVDQLVALGVIEPPFVIAGHSLGATLAMAVAMRRLDQTAALVISDGGYPQDSREAYVAHCLYLGLDRAFCESAMEGDDEAIQIGIDAAALAKPVPDLPVAVISSREPGPDCDLDDCQRITDLEAAAMEEDWKALGPHVTFTRVDGDHDGMLYTSRAEIVEIFRSVIELAGGDTP